MDEAEQIQLTAEPASRCTGTVTHSVPLLPFQGNVQTVLQSNTDFG